MVFGAAASRGSVGIGDGRRLASRIFFCNTAPVFVARLPSGALQAARTRHSSTHGCKFRPLSCREARNRLAHAARPWEATAHA